MARILRETITRLNTENSKLNTTLNEWINIGKILLRTRVYKKVKKELETTDFFILMAQALTKEMEDNLKEKLGEVLFRNKE